MCVNSYCGMSGDHAVFADVDPVLEAEEVGHLALGALAEAHLVQQGAL